jgi:hypothetical protein
MSPSLSLSLPPSLFPSLPPSLPPFLPPSLPPLSLSIPLSLLPRPLPRARSPPISRDTEKSCGRVPPPPLRPQSPLSGSHSLSRLPLRPEKARTQAAIAAAIPLHGKRPRPAPVCVSRKVARRLGPSTATSSVPKRVSTPRAAASWSSTAPYLGTWNMLLSGELRVARGFEHRKALGAAE